MVNYSEDLLFGLKTSFDEMHISIGGATPQVFNYRLGNCLLWILNCQERIKTLCPNDELFLGIRCAANCIKHNTLLEKLQIQDGFRFPTRIPFTLGYYYAWASLDHASEKIQNKHQLEAYKKTWRETT